MKTVIITGGTGMIGHALSRQLLAKGYRAVILSRRPRPAEGDKSYAVWDPAKSFIEPGVISNADHIIHLAGAGVADKRWTNARKKEIVESRVNGGRLIVQALRETPNHVESVVSASGIGWYGTDKKTSSRGFIESDPPNNDFLGNTCQQWEASIGPVTSLGKRLVIFRTAIVLSRQGGALPEFLKPLKAGVAGIIGSGGQIISWIHIDDICRAYIAAIENPHMSGVYNAAAPEPVSNKEFILKFAKARKRPFIAVHVPEFALKLMLGEMSIEILKSTTVDDSKLRNSGFHFVHPSFDAAVNALMQETKK